MYDSLDNDIANICRYEYDYFFNKANVIGVGLGYKEIRGIETCEKVIQVFVEKKLPLNSLCKNDKIPSLYKNIKTDVIEIGRCKINALTSRVRPVIGGYSIGPSGISIGGTYGGLVTDGTFNYLLSNNHVIAGENLLPIGNPILQPSTLFGGVSPRDIVGNLSRFIPLQYRTPSSYPTNYVDAAIARVIHPTFVSPKIEFIGVPRGTASASLGMDIKMTSQISEYLEGEIKTINATIVIGYEIGGKALFKDQILYSPITFPGDSGGLLLDMNNNVIGLNFAGTKIRSIANPIDLVLNALQVRLVTS